MILIEIILAKESFLHVKHNIIHMSSTYLIS